MTDSRKGSILVCALSFADGIHLNVRGYKQGLVTVDLHEYVEERQQPLMTETIKENLMNRIKGLLMATKGKQ